MQVKLVSRKVNMLSVLMYNWQIINVTSISGIMKSSSGGQFAYAASKAAAFQVGLIYSPCYGHPYQYFFSR